MKPLKAVPRPVTLLFVILFLVLSCAPAGAEQWDSKKGRYFKIFYSGGNVSQAEAILDQADAAFETIAKKWEYRHRRLGIFPKKRFHIYLFGDKKSYLAATKRPEWSRAAATVFPDKQILGYAGDSSFLAKDLPHEIAHLVFREVLGIEDQKIPLWLDEGIALLEEPGGRAELDPVLEKAAAENRIIPLADLERINNPGTLSSEKVVVFYAEAKSLVKFLLEGYGREPLLEFCRLLSDGHSSAFALQRTYGFQAAGISALEPQWLVYVRRQQLIAKSFRDL